MSDKTELPGELLYEYTSNITGAVEYGVSLQTLTSGQAPPPPEGARVDVYFEGPITGAKIGGSVKGVDYLNVRADGGPELHIHGEITTEDGLKIALAATGVAFGEPPVLQLRENVTLHSCHPEHSWVNKLQIWAPGTVDLGQGQIRIRGYAV